MIRPCLGMLVLLAASGCSSSSELILEVPAEAVADGLTPVQLKATAKFRGATLANGSRIKFKTSAGTLTTSGSSTPSTEVEASSTGGEATATLLPPKAAGEVTIIASFTNTNRESVSAQKTIAFKTAPPADARTLGVSCRSSCVSALVSGLGTLTLQCGLSARTLTGEPAPAVNARFLAEAGVIADQGAAADGTRQFSYVVTSGTARPVDVASQGDEADFETTDGTGLIKNPRDMVVTILAAVRASEDFTDLNGNNRYDEDEPFIDEPEPFLDVDDNGLFTVGIDRTLPDLDTNANGSWDNGNGVYDTDTWVGRSTRVVWTGDGTWRSDLSSLSLVSPGGPTSGSVQLTYVDEFGNSPCGFNATDAVTLSLSSTPSGLSVTGLGATPLTTELGMVFNSNGTFADLAKDANGVPVRRRFGVGFNLQPTGSSGVTNINLRGSAKYTPGPGTSLSSKTVPMSEIGVSITRTGP